jgi:single stranded DNA-binding protein
MSAEARQNGQEKQADFISIVAWRQSAEYAANYLGKGRLVAVEGRLQVREYQTNDGQRRRDTEVVVDNLKSLDRPKEGSEGGNGYGRSAREESGAARYDEDPGGASAAPTPREQPASRRTATAPANRPPEPEDDLDDPFADN